MKIKLQEIKCDFGHWTNLCKKKVNILVIDRHIRDPNYSTFCSTKHAADYYEKQGQNFYTNRFEAFYKD